MDLTGCKRVLIVKLSALGDVVHALPVAAALKDSYPHLEIDWAVEPLASDIVRACPIVSHVHVFPKERSVRRFRSSSASVWLATVRTLRERRYDLALDLQGLTKSSLVAFASGARRRLGYNWLRELSPLLVQRVPRRPESLHIVDQLLDVARYLGAEPVVPRFPINLPEQVRASVRDKLRQAGWQDGTPFLVMNPTEGGGGGLKGIPPAVLAEVADRTYHDTGHACVLIGAKGDRPRADEVKRLTTGPIFDLVGQTTVLELAAVISLAVAHVSGDSGSAHIAAALGVPPVTVFGRSNPCRVGPYGFERFVVDARRYCSERCRRHHERQEINKPAVCMDGSGLCMSRVTSDDVYPTLQRALEEASRSAAGAATP